MRNRFWLTYVILLVAQIILGDMLNLTQAVTLIFLPVMILSLPITMSTNTVMLIAFGTGLAADFFTRGQLGLCALSLVPVALCRGLIIRLIFGNELVSRKEDLSIRRHGLPRMTLCILIATALFFAIYVPVDCAGTRPFSFILLRFLLSTLVSVVVSLFIAGLLTPKETDRWN